MLGTTAKAALRDTLDVTKKAIPHVITHKLATTIARKQKRVDKGVTSSQQPLWIQVVFICSHRRIWYCIGLAK